MKMHQLFSQRCDYEQLISLLFGVMLLSFPVNAAAPMPAEINFRDANECRQWGAAHHISSLRPTPEGLEITITGADPYLSGPARDYPARELWMDLRLKSESGGGGQVFWFQRQPTEEHSAHFQVPPGEWAEVRISLPAMGTRISAANRSAGHHGQMHFSLGAVHAHAGLAVADVPATGRGGEKRV